jgi:hypothetical protein
MNSLEAQIAVSSNNSAVYNSGGRAFPFSGAAPVSNTRYVDLKEGSPFFNENWTNSKLVSQDGRVYQNVSVKLNLMENKVHYKDSSGKELVIGTPLREVLLQQASNGSAHFINGSLLPGNKQGWYQLLVNDTLSLLKGFNKIFEQHTSYGSATEYSIKTEESYLVYLQDKEFVIKKPSDFTQILPAKTKQIEQAIKTIKGKNKDEQFSLIAIAMNALLKTGH